MPRDGLRALIVTLPFLFAPVGLHGATVELRAIRLGVTPERTRIVLDLSGQGYSFQDFGTEDGMVSVRLTGVQPSSSLPSRFEAGGLVREIVLEPGPSRTVTVRVAPHGWVERKVFSLGAASGRPHRLVIDLTPAESPGTPLSPRPETPPADAPPEDMDPTPDPERKGPRTVVIDPGHGGRDPGATAKGLREKDVCLDVARRLAARLNEHPEFRAVLSREDDRFVSLGERMRLAERQDADLVVSIHVNAARSRRASGAEVFFLSVGAATDRASSELARLENEADPDYVVREDADLHGLPFIVSLRQSDTLLRSSRIAEVVLDVLATRRLAEPRGVKQAGFAVLKSFQVPSILVELGFISSQTDRQKLQTAEHRDRLAEAMAEGIRLYFAKFAPLRTEAGSPTSGQAPSGF